MLHSLTIKNFRGIATGEIPKLFPLSVLIGPNNSGKSTCLEAITITYGDAGEGLLYSLRRRGWVGTAGGGLVIPKDGSDISGDIQSKEAAEISEKPEQAPIRRRVTIRRVPVLDAAHRTMLVEKELTAPFTEFDVTCTDPGSRSNSLVFLDAKGLHIRLLSKRRTNGWGAFSLTPGLRPAI
jgi:hypothetical protein